MEDVYEELHRFFDGISPMGFPRTESGVEMELLKLIFTPEEAAMVVHLTAMPEAVEAIAERLDKDTDETVRLLEDMADKGQILRVRVADVTYYNAIPFAPGVMELNSIHAPVEVIRKFEGYYQEGFMKALVEGDTGLLRTLPVEETIPGLYPVAPYEQASEYIKKAPRPIAVADCGCRKMLKRIGKGCDHIMEACFCFGPWAQAYIDTGRGREIDEEEALKILKACEEDGLVHTTVNYTSLDQGMYMCNCCPCSCGVLRGINKFNKLKVTGFAHSSYIATVDEGKCSGCENCIDRCPVDALEMKNDVPVVNQDRCLGCGLCVTGCPEEAVQLDKREDQVQYPEGILELFDQVHRERHKPS